MEKKQKQADNSDVLFELTSFFDDKVQLHLDKLKLLTMLFFSKEPLVEPWTDNYAEAVSNALYEILHDATGCLDELKTKLFAAYNGTTEQDAEAAE